MAFYRRRYVCEAGGFSNVSKHAMTHSVAGPWVAGQQDKEKGWIGKFFVEMISFKR